MVERKDSMWILLVAGVATFIALSKLAPNMGIIGWLIGAGIGAVIGYFGYNVRGFVTAVPGTWRNTREAIGRMRLPMVGMKNAWAVIRAYRMSGRALSFWVAIWPIWVVSIGCLICVLVDNIRGRLNDPLGFALVSVLIGLILFGVVWAFGVTLRTNVRGSCNIEYMTAEMLVRYRWSRGRWKRRFDPRDEAISNDALVGGIMSEIGKSEFTFTWPEAGKAFLDLNLAYLVAGIIRSFWLIKMAFWGMGWLVVKSVVWMVLFTILLLRAIHSRERTICAIYGASGGLIMWWLVGEAYPQLTPVWQLTTIGAAGIISWLGGRYIGVPIIAKKILKIVPVTG